MPASSRRREGEPNKNWVPASPHVAGRYPVWPSDIIDLGHGVYLERTEPGHWNHNENIIEISVRGPIKAFIGKRNIFDCGDAWLEVARGVDIRGIAGGIDLLMSEEAEPCELRVEEYGREVARVKFERVTGKEAEEIKRREEAVNEKAWGHLREGTSDFSGPGY